jgi:hypothetical protein
MAIGYPTADTSLLSLAVDTNIEGHNMRFEWQSIEPTNLFSLNHRECVFLRVIAGSTFCNRVAVITQLKNLRKSTK